MSDLTLAMNVRKAPSWAAKTWSVMHNQYRVGAIRWDTRDRWYVLNTDVVANFSSDDLHFIGEFLREETNAHRYELWVKNCQRTSKQALAKKKPKPRR